MNQVIDIEGYIYYLFESTVQHIKIEHCIENPIDFIIDVVDNPDLIIESSWEKDTYLYYRKRKSGYQVVVASKVSQKIKTAYLDRKIKQGKIIWINPKIKG
jgi:hypothetical protein